MNIESKWLTPEEAAEDLEVTEGTLAVWRCTQRYPLPFYKWGSRVRNKRFELEEFKNAQRFSGTGEAQS